MTRLNQDRLAKLEGGLSEAAACGIAMGVAAVTGGWGILGAALFCIVITPSELN
ncbi:MAG TPA: hypothetical protein VIF32_10155 [Gemmatimonadaceae bacterium]|jgi:hypothetical protein